MILVMDLSYRPGSLSEAEFVAPVDRIVRQEGHSTRVRHYLDLVPGDLASAGGAILCGTTLADSGYRERMESFAWLPAFPGPVLGICAGMQVIARAFGIPAGSVQILSGATHARKRVRVGGVTREAALVLLGRILREGG